MHKTFLMSFSDKRDDRRTNGQTDIGTNRHTFTPLDKRYSPIISSICGPNKCETIHLGFNNMMRNYEINNVIVPTTRRCRDLGIKVSDDAKFSQHCTETVRVAYFRLKQFRLAFSCKDVDFQLHMYVTYIRPLLEYNTPVWSPHLLKDIDMV